MANKSKNITYGHSRVGSVNGTTMMIVNDSLNAKATFDEPSESGMIGTDKPANTGRQVVKNDVNGSITVRPSYVHANALMQAIFDETTGTFTPADAPTAQTFPVVVNRDVDIYTYADCWMQTLTIKANENEPIDWDMELLGTTETDAGTVSALTVPDKMIMPDLTFSVNANTYFIQGFEWSWTYAYDERFHQSLTRSTAVSKIPMAKLNITCDYNSDTWADLFALAGTDTAIEDVNLVFANGTNTLSILHPEMTVMNESKWNDQSGVDASSGTLELRAWLGSGEGDIFTATYA